MSKDEKVLLVAREWALKGENDLKNAAHTLKMGKECPTDTVCFHAQQCVEKYLKALLVLKDINFPMTHNIEEIISLVPEDLRPKLDDKEQDRLTEYATVTRYPGDYDPISLKEAREAVNIARRVRSHIRKLLPKKTVQKGRE